MTEPDGRTVTKKELVHRIAEELNQTKVVVRDVVQRFLDEIIAELARGNRLEFREFGVFEIRERSQRRAQNPRTLKKVLVPPRRVVRFKVGRSMRELVCDEPAAPKAPVKAAQPAAPKAEPTPARPQPPQPPPSTPGSPF
ncbi:MAG: HU family DNA-binding protein [Planctomycetota bacterium]